MSDRETPRLFVYGTLAPGRSNHHVMEPISGTWEPAFLRGTLLPEGWGAAQGFPAIIPCEAESEVSGLLFSSEELGNHWKRLDEFEGEGYRRIAVRVRLPSGEFLEAFVYALNLDQ